MRGDIPKLAAQVCVRRLRIHHEKDGGYAWSLREDGISRTDQMDQGSLGMRGLSDLVTDEMRRVLALIRTQRVAVLATHGVDGAPYANLVAIAASADGWDLGFCTRRATRKHDNMKAEPRVALLIDDRRGTADDLKSVTALTGIGTAYEVSGQERTVWERALLEAHPALAGVTTLSDCALLRVEVSRYLLVSQFERVVELRRPAPPDSQAR
jgi:heme iron utilization protein